MAKTIVNGAFADETRQCIQSRSPVAPTARMPRCGIANVAQNAILAGMSSAAKDHAGEFIKYLGLHEKAKSVSDQIGVTLFALQAVSEIHLLMDGRNDRPGAVRIIHAILGPFLVGGGEEKTGELYDELRKDAHLRPAI